MSFIKGIDVVLHAREEKGTDPFGAPIYEYHDITVGNILVEPITQTEIVSSTELNGNKTACRLCIPKGDNHVWEGNDVSFFGKRWKVYTDTIEYIDANVPLDWNKKILVEAYDL